MKTVAVIQARMGSQRLPGKALMEIGDRTILDWVVYRARKIQGVDEVVVATSWAEEDEALFFGVGSRTSVRGPTDDVLSRYVVAANELRAVRGFETTHILRVTADCPLLDPGLNSRILDTLHKTDADYVSVSTRSNGFVQEAFTIEALRRANENATKPYDREHVVPWMIRNLKTRFLKPDLDLGASRYCVDTEDDLDRLRSLYRANLDLFDLSAEEIVMLDAYVPAR